MAGRKKKFSVWDFLFSGFFYLFFWFLLLLINGNVRIFLERGEKPEKYEFFFSSVFVVDDDDLEGGNIFFMY